jgi:hypothetical protein
MLNVVEPSILSYKKHPMYRLTARSLLLLSFVGVLAPAMLSVAAPRQEACCVRHCCKSMAGHNQPSTEPSVQVSGDCHQECRCSLTVSQWADVAPRSILSAAFSPAILQLGIRKFFRAKNFNKAQSVRGPPPSSVA